MKNLNRIKKDFKRIKKLNFVKCTRPNNKDGGVGNTYEDLLGVEENNISKADYLGFEIKSKKNYTKSYITLFSKSPSLPKGANAYLRVKYGEVRDPLFPGKKKLYASVFGHRYSTIYEKIKMKLEVNRTKEQLELNIFNLKNKPIDQVLWTFNDLKKASYKINYLLLVLAEIKFIENERYYHFNNAEIYSEFNFERFLENIQNGGIQFDLRIGVHKSGKNEGKTHDHGSGFRVKKENFDKLYNFSESIQ